MKNIIFVVGARPNFMKVAPILKEIQNNYSKEFCPMVVHTGQHYDFNMSDIFFEQLKIPINPVCFNIGSGSHAWQTAEIMKEFDTYLNNVSKISLVVVVGDVNSSMATALVAAKKHIPIAHIEAGLRSFDKHMPEEINRIIIDSISDILFTTEPSANMNLMDENRKNVTYYVGNVMIDSLIDKMSEIDSIKKYQEYDLCYKNYILMTLHRPSNVDNENKFKSIISTIDKISCMYPVLFLVHPRTKKKIKEFNISLKNIICEEPMGYIENINLMKNAKLVITDSGGIQEETSFLQIPCVTLRGNTERPVTVIMGTNVIAGTDEKLYEKFIINALERKSFSKIPLWDGQASKRIMNILNLILNKE